MIGNDIVDLLEAKQKSNWQRPRFLNKIFTFKEQLLIHNSESPFLMVWRLWSMKEAAYKLYTQQNPSRFYNPKQFQCEINGIRGKVTYKDFKCEVETKITAQYIISETRFNTMNMASECIEMKSDTSKNQSEMIKDMVLARVSKDYNILKTELKIMKSDFGIPSVYQNTNKLNIGMSISHHGNYGIFAISRI